jgi:hypothetical protein
VSDLERLFQLIVTNLAATDAAQLHRPIPVTELQRSVVPYRSSRRPLEVVTSDEYEHLLLRLVAGEGGYAFTAPPESLARFRRELQGVNPDLAVLTADAEAAITLAPERIAAFIGGGTERSYRPPEGEAASPGPPALPEPAGEPVVVPHAPPQESEPEWESLPATEENRCSCCGGSLPEGRVVNFCPHCGEHLTPLTCPRCQAEVEFGWRHCIACGAALAPPQ